MFQIIQNLSLALGLGLISEQEYDDSLRDIAMGRESHINMEVQLAMNKVKQQT